MKPIKLILAGALLASGLASLNAQAQCADGSVFQNGVCYGADGPRAWGTGAGEGWDPSGGGSSSGYIPPTVVNSWGAAAWSKSTGMIGVASKQASKQASKRLALQNCGTDCEISQVYKNTCIAIATGEESNGMWRNTYSTNPDLETAKTTGLTLCASNSNNCNVIYTDCSIP